MIFEAYKRRKMLKIIWVLLYYWILYLHKDTTRIFSSMVCQKLLILLRWTSSPTSIILRLDIYICKGTLIFKLTIFLDIVNESNKWEWIMFITSKIPLFIFTYLWVWNPWTLHLVLLGMLIHSYLLTRSWLWIYYFLAIFLP